MEPNMYRTDNKWAQATSLPYYKYPSDHSIVSVSVTPRYLYEETLLDNPVLEIGLCHIPLSLACQEFYGDASFPSCRGFYATEMESVSM